MYEEFVNNFIELIDRAIQSDKKFIFYQKANKEDLEEQDYDHDFWIDGSPLKKSDLSNRRTWHKQDYRYIRIQLNKLKHIKEYSDYAIWKQVQQLMKVCNYIKTTNEDSMDYDQMVKASSKIQTVDLCIGQGFHEWKKAWQKGNIENLTNDFLIIYLDSLQAIEDGLNKKIATTKLNSVSITQDLFNKDLRTMLTQNVDITAIKLEILHSMKERAIIDGLQEQNGKFYIGKVRKNLFNKKLKQIENKYRKQANPVIAELFYDPRSRAISIDKLFPERRLLRQFNQDPQKGKPDDLVQFFQYMYEHQGEAIYNDELSKKFGGGTLNQKTWVTHCNFEKELRKLFWGTASNKGPVKLKLKITESDLRAADVTKKKLQEAFEKAIEPKPKKKKTTKKQSISS